MQSELALAMVQLWEDGLDQSLAAALEAEQPLEHRIDLVRSDSKAQVLATRRLVQRLAAEQRTRLAPAPPVPPVDEVPEPGGVYGEAVA